MLRNLTGLTLTIALISTLWSLPVQAQEIKERFNDLTVNAKLVLAEGKTLKDEVVLLTHGTLTHNGRETYQSIQTLLAENGISSLAPNLSLNINDRHGEYDCNQLHTHQHEDAMLEIDFWVKWLQSQGTTNLTLMGHSRGGNQTAWYSVEQDSDIIKKVVLIAPQTWSHAAEQADYKKRYGTDIAPLLNRASEWVKQGKGHKKLENIDFIYCKDTQVSAQAFVSYYGNEPRMDTPTLLEQAVKPTLVIIGSADQVVADLTAKMKKVNNKQVSSYIIEDSDHFFLDLFAEELVEVVVEFMQE